MWIYFSHSFTMLMRVANILCHIREESYCISRERNRGFIDVEEDGL